MNQSTQQLTKAAGKLSFWTALSRITGFVRDAVSASLLGAGWVSDAFLIAFRIPNLLRDLLAEGALSATFVPAMTKEREAHGDAAAWQLAALMLNSLLMVLGSLVLLGISFAPWVVDLAAPGFHARPEQFALTVELSRILIPFLALISVAALFVGSLNARRLFGSGARAPLYSNLLVLCVAGYLLLYARDWDTIRLVKAWSWATLAGGAMQMLSQLPTLWQQGFRPRFQWPFQHRGVRAIWAQMLPVVLAQSTTQLNLVVNTVLASMLAVGSSTYIYYGQRLAQLPVGIFGVAISTALLPDLASAYGGADYRGFKKTLGYGLRLTLFVTLPATLGLILLADPISILLFHHGRFSLQDSLQTGNSIAAYATSIIAASWVKILVPAFHAREESSVPVRAGLLVMALNLTLNLLLMEPFGFVGLALSASFCALVQALLLIYLLRRRLGGLWRSELLTDLGHIVLAALAMAGAVWLSRSGLDRGLPFEQLAQRSRLAWELPLLILLAIGVYFPITHYFGLDYLGPLLGKRRKLT